MSATWTPGTRFRVRPAGDRYDGVEGTARGSFTDPSGAEHVHARTDDGTHTTWPADRLERIETGLFQVGDRVMWSTGRGCPGTVESRDGWRYPEDLERFPNDVVVKWDDGMHSLVSPGALMAAPQDHGPLAAVLSDRTLAKVLSRPAYVPSVVLLDQRDAADRLAAAVEDVARFLRSVRSISDQNAYVHDLLKALADYRAAVQS